MSFKVGDKVVCIAVKDYIDGEVGKFPHPKVNDEVTITEISNKGWLSLLEFSYEFDYEYWNFRKLDYDFVEEVIEMINEDNLVVND